jgi:hypothetical protein
LPIPAPRRASAPRSRKASDYRCDNMPSCRPTYPHPSHKAQQHSATSQSMGVNTCDIALPAHSSSTCCR